MKRRLLLLDDDAAIVAVVGGYFEGKGFEVESSLAAAEALRIVESDAAFDAIVCDLHFTPARLSEGLGIVERARRKRPGSALLLFTGAVGDLYDLVYRARLFAYLVERGNIHTQNGCHTAEIKLAGTLHPFAAHADKFESIGEGQGARGGQSR